MSPTPLPARLTPLDEGLDDIVALIRRTAPRPLAYTQIKASAVPVRTCYETMTRLVGPRDAVLGYAAYLFADETRLAVPPSPPLAVEGVHLEEDGATLTLVLSRGSYDGG